MRTPGDGGRGPGASNLGRGAGLSRAEERDVMEKTIQAFGRERVAALRGRDWLRFLEETGSGVRLLDYESQILGAIYGDGEEASSSVNEILLNAKKWVQTHAAG